MPRLFPVKSSQGAPSLRTVAACLLLLPLLVHQVNDRAPLVVDGQRLINGTTLYCMSIGAGTAVMILHGGPGLDHSYLLPQMTQLVDPYELILFDQRGCGRSTASVDSSAMNLESLTEDIDAVRAAYNLEKVNLMGHSWGGLLAMYYAIRHPYRVNSLILVSSTPASSLLRDESFKIMAERTSRADSIDESLLAQSDSFKQREPKTMARYFRLLFRGAFYDPALAERLSFDFPPDYAARSQLMQYLAKDPALKSYDLSEELSSLHCPVLIVGGDRDFSPPEANEQIHSHIENSRLVTLKNCGHFPFIDAPAQFFPLVRDFLSKVPRN